MNRRNISGILSAAGFLIGSWAVLGPLRGKIPFFLGNNPIVHIMIILAIFLYLYYFVAKPAKAMKSAKESLKTLSSSAIYIVAALFIAGALVNLLPSEIIATYLGEQFGIIAVLVGIAIGCILPACPFISYPIIMGVYAAGAGLLGVMGMLLGSGTAFGCVLACDLTWFNTRIMRLRLILTTLAAVIAGIILYTAVMVLGCLI